MPIHVAPALRAREEAMEASGLMQPLDSVGITNQKSQENAKTTFRQSPRTTYFFNNTSYTPPRS